MNRPANTPTEPRQDDNARLSTLLKEWSAVEPSPAFDQGVWARIRRETVTAPPRVALLDFLRLALARPAWAAAAAAVIGIGLGIVAALVAPRPAVAGPQTERLLQRDTLAGSYLAMTTGGIR